MFSIAGLTVGVRRRSLVPKSVETIVIMRSNKGRVNFSEFKEDEEDDSSSDEEDAESEDEEPVTETVEEEEVEENSDEESEPEEEIRPEKKNLTKLIQS